jgi:hypothetical protein
MRYVEQLEVFDLITKITRRKSKLAELTTMIIHCTKQALNAWSNARDSLSRIRPTVLLRLNVVEYDRKWFVVFMNDASRHAVVIDV